MTELALCRVGLENDQVHLGLIAKGQVHDLTALDKDCYGSMEAFFRLASGRIEAALDELERVADQAPALCTRDVLFSFQEGSPVCLAPLDVQEVWACGVTYEMSREARMRESDEPTIYGRVYDAPRPEVFFKATPHRVVGPGQAVAIRADSKWDVPEPELTLAVTSKMELLGYTIGNDMSSRDIEGQNPLYLPQAKVYDRCFAVGPVVRLARGFDPLNLAVGCTIYRGGQPAFHGQTHTSRIHRPLSELLAYLGRCNSFPNGLFVCTGTGIVPPDTFTLAEGDEVEIIIEGLGTLRNPVIELPA